MIGVVAGAVAVAGAAAAVEVRAGSPGVPQATPVAAAATDAGVLSAGHVRRLVDTDAGSARLSPMYAKPVPLGTATPVGDPCRRWAGSYC